MAGLVGFFTKGAAGSAVQEVIDGGHAVQAGRQLVNGVVSRIQEIYQEQSSDTPDKKLDTLLTSAIASDNWGICEEKLTLLKQFSASLTEEQKLSGDQEKRLGDLLQQIEEKTDLNEVIGFLIKAQKEIANHAASSAIAAKVEKVAKEVFCSLSKAFVGKLEVKLPGEVYRSIYQKICQCQENSKLSLKEAVNTLLNEVDGIPEVWFQGFNVTSSLRDFLNTFLKESNGVEAIEDENFLDVIDDEAPSPSPQELREQVQTQKRAFIEDTNLFLIFTMTRYFCVPPDRDHQGNVIPMDHSYYVNLLANGKTPNELALNRTTANYLKRHIVDAASIGGRAYKRIATSLIWWFLSKIVPFFVSNLLNHHFDSFYNEYIASKEGPDASNRKLFDLIISRFGCYFSVLNGAYDRVRREDNVEGELSHHLAKELDRSCVYGNMSLNELYARFVRYELGVAFRGDILSKIANFMITPLISWKLAPRITEFLGNSLPARVGGFVLPLLLCSQLVPKVIDLTSFVVMKLFSWQLAPKLIKFIDKSISFLFTSNGYPHGINRILKDKLEGLKADLEQSDDEKQNQLASIPLSERGPIKACIESLLYALSNNMVDTIPELQKGHSAESAFYAVSSRQIAYVVAQLIQDLSRGRRVEQFFLELIQNLNKFYAISPNDQVEAAESKVDAEVKILAQKITHLYLKKFIEDLDLSGENRRGAFKKLIKSTKEEIRSFAVATSEQLRSLQLSENITQLEALKTEIEKTLERTNRVNESLKNPRSYSLMTEHKSRLETEDQEVSSIKTELSTHLLEIKKLVLQAIMTQMLLPIKQSLFDLKENANGENTIGINNFSLSEQTLKTCEITVLHQDWDHLEKASQEFEKNRQDKVNIQGLLEDISNNREAALIFLEKQSSIMQPLEIRKLRNDRAILMQAVGHPAENPGQASIFKRSLIAAGLKLGLVSEPVTQEIQAAALENIKLRLEAQLRERQKAMNEQKTKINGVVDPIQQKIEQKLGTFKANPNQVFETEKTTIEQEIQKLIKYEKDLQEPIFYNHVVITNKKITDIVFYLIEIPGLAVRYVDSVTSLFSKKETYRVLAPQAVFRHMINNS